MNHGGLNKGDHGAEINQAFVVWHGDLNEFGTGGDQRIEARAHDAFDIGIDARFIEVIKRHADAQPLEVAGETCFVVGHGLARRGRVARVVACGDLHQTGDVTRGARQRAEAIHRKRDGHRAEATDAGLGGFEANDTAKMRRQPNRAAGIRTQCAEHATAAHRRTGTRRRTTADVVRVPRIAAVTPMRVMAGGADGELGHVQPAHRDGARSLKSGDGGGRGIDRHVAANF